MQDVLLYGFIVIEITLKLKLQASSFLFHGALFNRLCLGNLKLHDSNCFSFELGYVFNTQLQLPVACCKMSHLVCLMKLTCIYIDFFLRFTSSHDFLKFTVKCSVFTLKRCDSFRSNHLIITNAAM